MKTEHKIPMEEVWKDINCEDSLVAEAAFCYYIENYASPEQKQERMKKSKSIVDKIYAFIYRYFPILLLK